MPVKDISKALRLSMDSINKLRKELGIHRHKPSPERLAKRAGYKVWAVAEMLEWHGYDDWTTKQIINELGCEI